jgi:hypothetical protein
VLSPPKKKRLQKIVDRNHRGHHIHGSFVSAQANQYSATARVHASKDVSDVFLRWAQNRKRRKLRVFQQTVTIVPTTVKIGDPKDTTTHRLVDGFLIFGISEFMIVDTVPVLQELAKEFATALGQKYVEAHYLDKGFFVKDERPLPTKQRVTWSEFLTCTLHTATGERVQTLPGNLKDFRGPVGDGARVVAGAFAPGASVCEVAQHVDVVPTRISRYRHELRVAEGLPKALNGIPEMEWPFSGADICVVVPNGDRLQSPQHPHHQ